MVCYLCKEFRKRYPLVPDDNGELEHVLDKDEDGTVMTSSPIRCAFEDSEIFATSNWNCETIRLLRQCFGYEAHQIQPIWHNDSNLGILPIPICKEEEEEKDIQQGMLVLAWYKNRGRTGQAMVFCDIDEPKPLNLKTALFIVKMHEKNQKAR